MTISKNNHAVHLAVIISLLILLASSGISPTFAVSSQADSNAPNTPPFEDSGITLQSVYLGEAAWGDYDNDGDLDILRAGGGNTQVYRNDGGSGFTDINAGLKGLEYSSVAWGDSDKDGDLDFLLIGWDGSNGSRMAYLYRNDGGDVFTKVTIGPGLSNGSCTWADYDNDGDLDFLLTGWDGTYPDSRLYRNNGAGTFSEVTATIMAATNSHVAWGDYDNDGNLDILMVTGAASVIYRNDGAGIFTDIGAGLEAISGSVAWGDYDNDGDLDVLMSGYISGGNVSKVYSNEGGGVFTDINASLASGPWSSAAWGDYDNDGDLDILLTAEVTGVQVTKVYRNDGGGAFTDINAGLPAGTYIAWGDYDNDGKLDILLGGMSVTKIYHNITASANTPPSAPTGLSASIADGIAAFGWNPAEDDQTLPEGLTYNLRLGTTPGGSEIAVPMADLDSGYRRLPALGNTNLGITATLGGLDLPPFSTYYWSVQAVDSAWAGSPFALEGSFSVPLGVPALDSIANTDRDGDYTLSWNVVPYATTYTLEEDNDPGFLSPATRYQGVQHQYQVNDQPSGGWYYRVRASNANGESVWSSTQTVCVQGWIYLPVMMRRYPPIPDAPALYGISNPGGDDNYSVSWSPADLAESYILEESINSDFSDATQVYNGVGTSTDINSKDPTRYYYRVKSHNAYGDSGWSNVQSVDVFWELEPNDIYLQANGPLLSGLPYYGYPNDQKDYFSFYLPTAGTISIDLTNHTGGGVQVQLFYEVADAGHRVGFDYDAPYHIAYSGAAGWYYVYIYTASGFNTSTPYTLQVTYP